MSTLLYDLRYGFRMLLKNPGFTAVAVLTLALGIGVNTALFSVVNGVLLSPLPYSEPGRLVALYARDANYTQASISYPNYLDWARDNHSFSSLAAYRGDQYTLTGEGEPERVGAEMISASLFSLLGVRPVLGRVFLPEEDRVGAAPVLLIGDGYWKRKFGAAPDVLGKALTLNGVAYTVVGVVPEDPNCGGTFYCSDVYTPIGQWNDPTFRDRRTALGMQAVGRLKAGVSFTQARADMDSLGRRLSEEYPEADKGAGITLVPLKQDLVGNIQPFLLMLMAAVGFVLLIACVNVANLLLARSAGRTREFAIRAALGANRARVLRQVLTESVLLAVAGGGLGLLLTSWGIHAALRTLPAALPRATEIQVNWHVLLFTLAGSVLAGILFGLAPALKNSQVALEETLKEGGRGSSGARHRAQGVFVVAEMALAVVLLAGAGLMIRSLAKLSGIDPGFDAHNVLTFSSGFSSPGSASATRARWRAMGDSLRATPGVVAASLSVGAHPFVDTSDLPFWLEGQPKPATLGDMKLTLFYVVQPDYLKVMRIPLRGGRFLSEKDNEHSPLVAVIDDRFRQLYFGHEDPIGRRVNFGVLNVSAEIVGVVGHVKQTGLGEGVMTTILPQCYLALPQFPEPFVPLLAGNTRVLVRTAESPLAQVGAIRQALAKISNQQAMYGARTMESAIRGTLAARRFSMILLGVFAALALLMACVGIYGVISYLAAQRTHEIGLRMALGAEPRHVLQMVLGAGAKMALLGVGIGLAVALALARFLASLVFGVSTYDPLTFAGVAGLLVLVALAACYLPARRATRVEPTKALRWE